MQIYPAIDLRGGQCVRLKQGDYAQETVFGADPAAMAKRWVADYFRENFYLTTSGNFSTSALNQAIAEIGIDRVLWSADYPFEDVSDAAEWIDAAPLSEPDRERLVRGNAQKLFRL